MVTTYVNDSDLGSHCVWKVFGVLVRGERCKLLGRRCDGDCDEGKTKVFIWRSIVKH